MEVTLGGQLVDRRALGLDFHFGTSLNANKVVSLGATPPQIGVDQLDRRRLPDSRHLGASRSPAWHDKNDDGILTVDEVDDRADTLFDDTVDPVTGKRVIIGVGTFRGYAEPRYLTTFTSGIDLFNHRLRIQSLFDWRGGNTYYNKTERIRCTRPNCNGLFNPERLARGAGDGRRGDLHRRRRRSTATSSRARS